jgi:uncharacterized membrane protein YeaQ/YmgE (transglycosylase-associated protein family)
LDSFRWHRWLDCQYDHWASLIVAVVGAVVVLAVINLIFGRK